MKTPENEALLEQAKVNLNIAQLAVKNAIANRESGVDEEYELDDAYSDLSAAEDAVKSAESDLTTTVPFNQIRLSTRKPRKV